MGKAQPGQMLATTAVLERSATRVRARAARAVHGQGQVHADRGRERRADARRARVVVGHDAARRPRGGDGRAARGRPHRPSTAAGRVVDLVGEPGIGKSRLVEELLASAALPAYVAGCDQYEMETAYWPMRALLRAVLGVAADAPGSDVLDALNERVAERRSRTAPVGAAHRDGARRRLLPDPRGRGLAEEFRKARLEDTVVRFLTLIAARAVGDRHRRRAPDGRRVGRPAHQHLPARAQAAVARPAHASRGRAGLPSRGRGARRAAASRPARRGGLGPARPPAPRGHDAHARGRRSAHPAGRRQPAVPARSGARRAHGRAARRAPRDARRPHHQPDRPAARRTSARCCGSPRCSAPASTRTSCARSWRGIGSRPARTPCAACRTSSGRRATGATASTTS